MEYAKEILNERLEQLNNAYEKFVVSGQVNSNSSVALNNRKKAQDIMDALVCLSENNYKKVNHTH